MQDPKPQILVVDDSRDLQESFRFVLTEAGYDVIAAHSGEEGLQKTKALKPDLILLDLSCSGWSHSDGRSLNCPGGSGQV
jgi:two-component system, NtrC family, response regulator